MNDCESSASLIVEYYDRLGVGFGAAGSSVGKFVIPDQELRAQGVDLEKCVVGGGVGRIGLLRVVNELG